MAAFFSNLPGNNQTHYSTFIRYFYVVTYVVPPILPVALTAKLQPFHNVVLAKKIFCHTAKHISLGGGVDIAFFDKVFQSF